MDAINRGHCAAESGIALIPVLLFMLMLSFLALILMKTVFSGSIQNSRGILQANLRTALSVGAEDAANQLNAYSNWPEIIAASGTRLDGYQNIASNVFPTAPQSGFWQSCVSNHQCLNQSLQTDGQTLQIAWTILPSNGYAKRLEGYAVETGVTGPTQRNYIAFIRAVAPNGVTATEAVILKKSLL